LPLVTETVEKKLAAVLATRLVVMRKPTAIVGAPRRRARRGRKPNTTAQTPNWHTALAKDGSSTSGRMKMARMERTFTARTSGRSGRVNRTDAMMTVAATASPAATRNARR
jgi:hypothetical protein